MFTHPHIGCELVRDRQREMLAYTDQQRLARRCRAEFRARKANRGLGAGGVHPGVRSDARPIRARPRPPPGIGHQADPVGSAVGGPVW